MVAHDTSATRTVNAQVVALPVALPGRGGDEFEGALIEPVVLALG